MSSTKPPFRFGSVAIVGRPNVGKSTLLNKLIGTKISIVSRKPQTTRQRVRGVLTTDTAQFVFVDTPGYQTQHSNALLGMMNRNVKQTFGEVDVVVFMSDAERFNAADAQVLAIVPKDLPVIAVLNKVDEIADKSALLPAIAAMQTQREFAAIVPISAQRGTQVKALLAEIEKHLPEGAAVYDPDTLTDRDDRFMAAEFVREKLFRLLGDELPYGTAVVIEKFEEQGKLRRIFAAILVDDENHKPMVLGKGGAKIKRIATDARVEMENLFGGKVYLELFVKVRSGWAETEASLRKLGFQ